MRCLRWIAPVLPALIVACNSAKGPAPDVQPLGWGDAEWPEAPYPESGPGSPDDDDDDGDDEGGFGFVPDDDFHSVSECDPLMQDCPEGEKCVAIASTGGELDLNKCVAVYGNQLAGEACEYGGSVEGTDDCDANSYCWNVVDGSGTCAQFCEGDSDDPMCPDGLECLLGSDGAVVVCVDDARDTGAPEPDPESESESESETGPDDSSSCPDEPAPVVLYMSNDDSNSQASPVIVRRQIHDGLRVDPSQIRIHEFLNYYTISTDYPENQPAKVGIQMRRTDEATGEFSLLLTASGQQLREEDRSPLNLVFSIDTSGSMAGEPLELVEASMRALAGELRVGDVISMVRWSEEQTIVLDTHAVSGPDDPALLAAINALEPGGSTNFSGGLATAYQLAQAGYVAGGINRVILMSDGGANAGTTSVGIISAAAAAEDGSGIYLVGVGVAASNYKDALMDEVTDHGKGAYVFIDSVAEAERQFGDRFSSNVSVAARNVQMRVTLPWYFGIKSFHGEGYSTNPVEVEPQHLAPNDSMNFHQVIAACDPSVIDSLDTIEAHVEYLHPLTLAPMSDMMSLNLGALVKADADQLHKADAVIAFAKSLLAIEAMLAKGGQEPAIATAEAMHAWLGNAAATLGGDVEIAELAALMGEYAVIIAG